MLRTVTCHNSYRSNDGIEEVFKAMFPDSGLVQSFTCGKDKTRYVTLNLDWRHISKNNSPPKSKNAVRL